MIAYRDSVFGRFPLDSFRSARHSVMLGVAYFAAAGAAASLTRFEGGVACLWIANALMLAALSSRRPAHWFAPVMACSIGGMAATALFGLGPIAAMPLMIVNTGEVLLSASLLSRWNLRGKSLSSLSQFAGFVLAAGFAGPLPGAVIGGTTAALISGTPIASNMVNFFLAHSLGALTFFPIFTFIVNGDLRRWVGGAAGRLRVEGTAVLGLVAVTTVAVFGQSNLPLLFLPMLPVILATFWLGRFGAAASVVLIASIGGVLTARGLGPVYLVNGGTLAHVQFFQFYLAMTVLTALPVAAELARRKRLNEQLRDSEARFRLLADHSTDIIMTLDPQGRIKYASPSISQIGNYDAEAIIGTFVIEMVALEDRGRVREAHMSALAAPTQTFLVEYRAVTGDGEMRWFETTTRCVTDEDGSVAGVVSAIRDISHRKIREAELARAATIDPLTGLLNRRGFNDAFARRLGEMRDTGISGCIAIFDVDHFKRVNDTFGHDVGDHVLESFAAIAQRTVRDSDIVGRLGGEEFGVILPGVSIEQAHYICDRLRIAFGETALLCGTARVSTTVSAGVAAFNGESQFETIMKSADTALYAAKNAGRDRLMIAA